MHPAHSFDFEETPVGIFFVCVAFFFAFFFPLHHGLIFFHIAFYNPHMGAGISTF